MANASNKSEEQILSIPGSWSAAFDSDTNHIAREKFQSIASYNVQSEHLQIPGSWNPDFDIDCEEESTALVTPHLSNDNINNGNNYKTDKNNERSIMKTSRLVRRVPGIHPASRSNITVQSWKQPLISTIPIGSDSESELEPEVEWNRVSASSSSVNFVPIQEPDYIDFSGCGKAIRPRESLRKILRRIFRRKGRKHRCGWWR